MNAGYGLPSSFLEKCWHKPGWLYFAVSMALLQERVRERVLAQTYSVTHLYMTVTEHE